MPPQKQIKENKPISILKKIYYNDIPEKTRPVWGFIAIQWKRIQSVFKTKRRKPRKILLTSTGRLIEKLSFGRIWINQSTLTPPHRI
jgi:hypothetical protein